MRTSLLVLALSCSTAAACGGQTSEKPAPSASDAKASEAKAGDAKSGDAKADAAKTGDAKADAAPKPAAKDARTWTFDDAAVGQVPAGIRVTEAGGIGTPATWAVVADPSAPTQPHAFGITESKNTKKTYNLAIVEGTSYGDVDLQVMVKAGTGVLNQGGGVMWRVKDADNYYLARWDPIEDNAYFYIVKSGVRTALAKLDLELDPASWHSLRVVAQGSRMELFIDDEPKLTAENAEHTEPGMIGLWTKSDAATMFDDLSVATP